MIKKIKDLTLEEMKKICLSKVECNCPFHICYFKMLQYKDYLEQEVEVDE